MRNWLRRLIPESARHRAYLLREKIWRTGVNWAAGARIWYFLRLRRETIRSFTPYEQRFHSQNWEDGIIAAIFSSIGATNRYFVEFGVEDGSICNTRRLLETGWTGLQMDGGDWGEHPVRKKEFITAENINDLFRKYGVPKEFDLLSIDIDGNDYWVWKAISGYAPRVVIIEYNGRLPAGESKTIRYDPDFRWDSSDYQGATLLALHKLGKEKGYTLVGCDSNGVNAFFVQDSLIPGHFRPEPPEKLHRPIAPQFRGARHDAVRPWVAI